MGPPLALSARPNSIGGAQLEKRGHIDSSSRCSRYLMQLSNELAVNLFYDRPTSPAAILQFMSICGVSFTDLEQSASQRPAQIRTSRCLRSLRAPRAC